MGMILKTKMKMVMPSWMKMKPISFFFFNSPYIIYAALALVSYSPAFSYSLVSFLAAKHGFKIMKQLATEISLNFTTQANNEKCISIHYSDDDNNSKQGSSWLMI
mmetsp:Transcript_25327/g.24234  ORF Transcript_25327/g.24234 Transcript_25327/m.24234 type:complete len:105 (-) Transcript_25327:60-374(-)